MNPNASAFVPRFMRPPAAAAAPAPAPAPAPAAAPAKTTTPPAPVATAPKPAKTTTPPPAAAAAAPKKAKTPTSAAAAPKKAKTPPPQAAAVPAKAPKPTKAEDGDDEDGGGMHFSDEQIAAELRRMELEERGASPSAAAAAAAAAGDEDPTAVSADTRENVNVVFIGHVDSGKSTISGQVLFLTGRVDKRLIEKYEREAKENNRETWWLAYVTDQIAEEKARGKTIEVGRALFDTPLRKYTILDAPGHKSYVPNMIAGAAQADVGILVISARRGEFESGFEKAGQTREHAQLAKTVGIRQLIVVVNKMDDLGWSQERFDEIQAKVAPFLKSLGYQKKDLTWLPISGFTGANIRDRVDPALCPWYQGPSMIEALDAIQLQHGREDLAFRMPLIDKFKDARGNTVIMGKVETGSIRVGDQLVLMPPRTQVEVLGITTDDNTALMRTAKPGDNVRVMIKGEVAENISAGWVASALAKPCAVATEFEAQVIIMDLQPPKSIFCAGYQAVMHIHTTTEEITVSSLVALLDRQTGKPDKRRPKFVRSGAAVVCHIEVARPVAIERFADFQQLGRFTLRDAGKTVAFGKITALRTSAAAAASAVVAGVPAAATTPPAKSE